MDAKNSKLKKLRKCRKKMSELDRELDGLKRMYYFIANQKINSDTLNVKRISELEEINQALSAQIKDMPKGAASEELEVIKKKVIEYEKERKALGIETGVSSIGPGYAVVSTGPSASPLGKDISLLMDSYYDTESAAVCAQLMKDIKIIFLGSEAATTNDVKIARDRVNELINRPSPPPTLAANMKKAVSDFEMARFVRSGPAVEPNKKTIVQKYIDRIVEIAEFIAGNAPEKVDCTAKLSTVFSLLMKYDILDRAPARDRFDGQDIIRPFKLKEKTLSSLLSELLGTLAGGVKVLVRINNQNTKVKYNPDYRNKGLNYDTTNLSVKINWTGEYFKTKIVLNQNNKYTDKSDGKDKNCFQDVATGGEEEFGEFFGVYYTALNKDIVPGEQAEIRGDNYELFYGCISTELKKKADSKYKPYDPRYIHITDAEMTNASYCNPPADVWQPRLADTVKEVTLGYNLIFFGYGYSGSGKTFTLLGNTRKGDPFQCPGFLQLAMYYLGNIPGSKVSIDAAFELYGVITSDKVNPKFYSKINVYRDFTNPQHQLLGNGGNAFKLDVEDKRADITALYGPGYDQAIDLSDYNAKKSKVNHFTRTVEYYRKDNGFIKHTPNNPESSRGHLFYVVKYEGPGGVVGYLTIVDMGGIENPLDIANQSFNPYAFCDQDKIEDVQKAIYAGIMDMNVNMNEITDSSKIEANAKKFKNIINNISCTDSSFGIFIGQNIAELYIKKYWDDEYKYLDGTKMGALAAEYTENIVKVSKKLVEKYYQDKKSGKVLYKFNDVTKEKGTVSILNHTGHTIEDANKKLIVSDNMGSNGALYYDIVIKEGFFINETLGHIRYHLLKEKYKGTPEKSRYEDMAKHTNMYKLSDIINLSETENIKVNKYDHDTKSYNSVVLADAKLTKYQVDAIKNNIKLISNPEDEYNANTKGNVQMIKCLQFLAGITKKGDIKADTETKVKYIMFALINPQPDPAMCNATNAVLKFSNSIKSS